MDEDTKKIIRRAVEKTEIGLTRSILRWKYKKEGRQVPLEPQLEEESRRVAGRASRIISKSGKNVWNELKKAYRETKVQKEDSDG
jgi:hypothetical protein